MGFSTHLPPRILSKRLSPHTLSLSTHTLSTRTLLQRPHAPLNTSPSTHILSAPLSMHPRYLHASSVSQRTHSIYTPFSTHPFPRTSCACKHRSNHTHPARLSTHPQSLHAPFILPMYPRSPHTIPRSGELRTQKLKSHLVRTQSLNVLPFKPGVGQYIAIHATLTARNVFLAFYPSGPFSCIFSKTSPDFSLCWLWLTHGSCVGPQNKIGHPARCRFPLSARGI